MKKNVSGEGRQAILAIPGQRCFELISLHQEGIHTCTVYAKNINKATILLP